MSIRRNNPETPDTEVSDLTLEGIGSTKLALIRLILKEAGIEPTDENVLLAAKEALAIEKSKDGNGI